ncbi:MAG TPA: type II toxin-antitoxin system HicB family antitoxin [Candidatus Acidoferrum sp.]|nr:type II toxin-antitoxin system HicB family antitoxin [Candidatus Acidoferrum sp.]
MKELNYYLKLKYPIEVVETDSGYVVSHPDLPGCASFGDTIPEAIESLSEVRELWLQGQIENHGAAPEPRQPEDYSGRFVIRLPKWLHRVLDSEAQRQACSLNTLVVSLLSLGIGASARSSAAEATPTENWEEIHEWQADWGAPGPIHWSMRRFLGVKDRRFQYAAVLSRIAKQTKTPPKPKESEYGESRNVTEAKTVWKN